MDEQRLERALRAGPPFATAYVARPLSVAEAMAAMRPVTARRTVLLLAVVAMLLAATIVGLALAGLFRAPAIAAYVEGHCDRDWVCDQTLTVIAADGGRRVVFPNDDGTPAFVGSLAWSPDGRRLGFLSGSSPAFRDPVLYVVDSDGSNLRSVDPLELDREQTVSGGVSWSPDGRAIALLTSTAHQEAEREEYAIWVIDVSSGSAKLVAQGTGYWWDVSWSPDGSWIIYEGDVTEPGRRGIWAVPAAGSASRLLVSDWDGGLWQWSPDGAWILYSTSRSVPGGPWQSIWIVRPDGSDRRQLKDDLPVDDPSSYGVAWSPDSRAVALPGPIELDGDTIDIVHLDGETTRIKPRIHLPDRNGEPVIYVIDVVAWYSPEEIAYVARGIGWAVLAESSPDGLESEAVSDVLPWDLSREVQPSSDRADLYWLENDGRCRSVFHLTQRTTARRCFASNEPLPIWVGGPERTF